MKANGIIRSILAAIIICTIPSTYILADNSDYYEKMLTFLDPDNPVRPVPIKNSDEDGGKEKIHLLGVKYGMSIADVLLMWGKPRALGGTTSLVTSLQYGEYLLTFHKDKLENIYQNNHYKKADVSTPSKTNTVTDSFASTYSENLYNMLNFKRRNTLLTTNSVISIEKLKKGEIGGIKLGQSMSEVITVRDKPSSLCYFSKDNAYLSGWGTFHEDSLTSFYISRRDISGAKFDNGLTTKDSISNFEKAFGTPLDSSKGYRHTLCYKFDDVYVYFYFSASKNSEEQTNTTLSSIRINYYGWDEVCNSIRTEFIKKVSETLEIKPDKIEGLSWSNLPTDTISEIEKILGKSLTEAQRKDITAINEEAEKKHHEALKEYRR